jgi:beta-lactam-binding protein with PASTA domain
VIGESKRSRQPRRPRRGGARRRPPGDRDGLSWARWLLGGLGVAIASFFIGWLLAVRVLFPAPPVTTDGVAAPSLVGTTLAEASRRLALEGLVLGDHTEIPHPVEAQGVVTAQSPLPGQQLRPGAAVDVAISAGRPRALVPNLVGLDGERAVELLERLGFRAERRVEDALDPEGRVIRLEPAPGTERELPSLVTVVVSTGPPEPEPMDTLPPYGPQPFEPPPDGR